MEDGITNTGCSYKNMDRKKRENIQKTFSKYYLSEFLKTVQMV